MSEEKHGQEYVAGFMFNEHRDHVALIRKTKPPYQAGKLNGIGGKIEPGELSCQAMVREFEEETGYRSHHFDWSLFCILEDQSKAVVVGSGEKAALLKVPSFRVFFYRTFVKDDVLNSLRSPTEEKVGIFQIKHDSPRTDTATFIPPDVMPNCEWLIPMAFTTPFRTHHRVIVEEGN